MKAFQQGDLNGLCGLYAVVNAFQQCLDDCPSEQNGLDFFKEAARSIPSGEFPDILWGGCGVQTLLKMARAVAEDIERECDFKFKIWRPFRTAKQHTSKDLLNGINDIWSKKSTTFIISVQWAGEEAGGHWSVLETLEDDVLKLRDSNGCKAIDRRSIALHGVNKHVLPPTDIVAIRLTAIDDEPVD